MGPIHLLIVLSLTLAATSVVLVSGQAFKDVTLKVVTVLDNPFLMIKETEKNVTLSGNERFEGFIVDLLKAVADKAGFQYELGLVADGKFGQLVNGTWVGLIRELVDMKADLAAAPLTVTPTRLSVIDFTVPFLNSGPVILMRKLSRHPTPSIFERIFNLLIPFSDSVWLTIIIAYILTGICLYFVSYCNPYEWRKMARDGLATIREAESFTCLNTFWFLLSTFMWQGYIRAPRSLGGRVISGFWWLFVVFCLLTYTAALTNYMRAVTSFTPRYPPISSFDDLAFTKSFKVGAIADGSTHEYLQTSKLPGIRRIWDRIDREGSLVSSVSEGFIKIREREVSYAFIMESATARYHASGRPCDFVYTEPDDLPYFQALGLPRDSPYRDSINMALIMIRSSGELKAIGDRWLNQGECSSQNVVPRGGTRRDVYYYSQLDIGTFTGALVLLGIGLVAGCLLTAIEVGLFKLAEKRGDNEEEEQPSTAAKRESDV